MKCYFTLLCVCIQVLLVGQQTVGVIANNTDAYDGYTLFSPNNHTYLIDNCGRLINEWVSEHQVSVSVYLLPNGDLLRSSRVLAGVFSGGGVAGRFERFNWEGDLEWTYEYASAAYQAHHDFEPLPNGNILVLAYELRSMIEHEAAGASLPAEVWSEKVVELMPLPNNEATIVWEWDVWDRAIQNMSPTLPNYGLLEDHPERFNINYGDDFPSWLHINAVDYNAQRDEILLSSRNTGEIYIIDHSTTTAEAASSQGGNKGKGGDFLFRWGNPAMYNGIGEEQLFGQHDAQWIPEGYEDAGQITIFNNNNPSQDGLYSSIVQINPYETSDDYALSGNNTFLPSSANWIYNSFFPPNFHEPKQCGAMRLANGNTLITNSRKGEFFEVDKDGVEQWRYHNPVAVSGPVEQGTVFSNSSVFRAVKYALDYSAFEDKDLTPGLPIELSPTIDFCIGTAVIEQPIHKVLLLKNQLVTDNLIFDVMDSKKWEIRVFDLRGQLKQLGIIDNMNNELPIETLNAGYYFVQAINVKTQTMNSFKCIKI